MKNLCFECNLKKKLSVILDIAKSSAVWEFVLFVLKILFFQEFLIVRLVQILFNCFVPRLWSRKGAKKLYFNFRAQLSKC